MPVVSALLVGYNLGIEIEDLRDNSPRLSVGVHGTYQHYAAVVSVVGRHE